MNNINIIKTGINVSKILNQLKRYPDDWNNSRKLENVHSNIIEQGFPKLDIGVLQLNIGGITKAGDYVGDSEICINTPAYQRHTEIVRFLKRNGYENHSRCGFLSLPVGGVVGQHIDIGSYYLTRNRYHLSIQGTYQYTVGDESIIVEAGTLFSFNNKLSHGTENIGDDVRITFVFDVLRSEL